MANVEITKLKMPEGVSRKTHFITVNRDYVVIAIERTPEMKAKASATRRANAKVKRERREKKEKKLAEKIQRRSVFIAKRESKLNAQLKALEIRKNAIMRKLK